MQQKKLSLPNCALALEIVNNKVTNQNFSLKKASANVFYRGTVAH